MRIAQVAPVHLPVPPPRYGGIERVVDALAAELLALGHEVTVFASGDSTPSAPLEPLCERSVVASGEERKALALHLAAMERLVRRASEFDLWHFHFNYLHLPFLRRHPEMKSLTTMHVRLDIPDVRAVLAEYRELSYVSISNAQRRPVPMVNWRDTVYNGLPRDLYRLQPERGDYLAFVGRFSEEKGLHTAVEAARRFGMKLKVGGRFDPTQPAYTEEVVRPLLRDPLVEYVGEVDDRDKQELLGGAHAVLFPIQWPEPFGLVMIEALACGTPVVACPLGAAPEVLRDGVTGYFASTAEEMARALERVELLDRAVCRAEFERRFSSRAMAEGYLAVYHRMLDLKVEPLLLKGA